MGSCRVCSAPWPWEFVSLQKANGYLPQSTAEQKVSKTGALRFLLSSWCTFLVWMDWALSGQVLASHEQWPPHAFPLHPSHGSHELQRLGRTEGPLCSPCCQPGFPRRLAQDIWGRVLLCLKHLGESPTSGMLRSNQRQLTFPCKFVGAQRNRHPRRVTFKQHCWAVHMLVTKPTPLLWYHPFVPPRGLSLTFWGHFLEWLSISPAKLIHEFHCKNMHVARPCSHTDMRERKERWKETFKEGWILYSSYCAFLPFSQAQSSETSLLTEKKIK